jgi:hypothetical protein
VILNPNSLVTPLRRDTSFEREQFQEKCAAVSGIAKNEELERFGVSIKKLNRPSPG